MPFCKADIKQHLCLQTVSYTQFLYPTNVLGGRRNTIDSTSSFSQSRNASHRSLSLGRANSNQSSLDTGEVDCQETLNVFRMNVVFFSALLMWKYVAQILTQPLVVVSGAHGRERLGGLSRVRPKSAGRPAVALWKTQESPHLPLLHGKKVLLAASCTPAPPPLTTTTKPPLRLQPCPHESRTEKKLFSCRSWFAETDPPLFLT